MYGTSYVRATCHVLLEMLMSQGCACHVYAIVCVMVRTIDSTAVATAVDVVVAAAAMIETLASEGKPFVISCDDVSLAAEVLEALLVLTEGTDAQMRGWTLGCMHGCVDARKRGCADGCMDARMHGCVDARMRGCVDAWMHGCIDACQKCTSKGI